MARRYELDREHLAGLPPLQRPQALLTEDEFRARLAAEGHAF